MKFRRTLKTEALENNNKAIFRVEEKNNCLFCKEETSSDITESCEGYAVRKYGSWWFGITGPDGLMLRDEQGKLCLFKTSAEATKYINSHCASKLTEDLSAREKLKAAYPELNFEESLTEGRVVEDLTNTEKLKRAYPELNFDDSVTEKVISEDLSNREKLLKAYPELTFDSSVTNELMNEEMSIRDKLKSAYPELNFDKTITEDTDDEDSDTEFEDEFDEYDDDYDMDDVEQDYAHAALYGGDLTYCKKCGARLKRDEYGSYCPTCENSDNIQL